jgi:hypothetical protein
MRRFRLIWSAKSIILLAGLPVLAFTVIGLYFGFSALRPNIPSRTGSNSPARDTLFGIRIPLRINNLVLKVEIAATSAQRARGLSGRLQLPPNQGMLFVFPAADYHAFWMKDMHFPLDIIWIDDEQRIVDIAPDLSPDTYPRLFRPRQPARYVLEVQAGTAAKYGLKIGDSVYFTLPPHVMHAGRRNP